MINLRRLLVALLVSACVAASLVAAPSASAETRSVVASADTYVHELVKTTNNGTSASLASYGSPTVTSFMRFAVPVVPPGEEVVSASLRLRTTALASSGSANAQQVRLSTGAWSESSTLWANRPGTGAVIGTLAAPAAAGSSYEVGLDAAAVAATAGSELSLAVAGTGTDSAWFASREASVAAQRPTLVIVTAPAVPSDTTPPSAPGDLATTVEGSSVALSWSAATDDTAVTSYEVHRSAVAGFTPSAATLAATRTTTTFSDSRPAGTWRYVVVALDAAGNRSAVSSEVSAVVEPTPTGPPVAVVASADTYVHDLARTTNYGSSPSLAAYGTPNVVSFLRFAVPSVPAGQRVVSASLRLRTSTLTSAGSANDQQVRLASGTWSEATTLYANRPALGAAVGSLASPTAANRAYDVPLDAAAVGAAAGDALSLAVTGTGSDSFWFTAREATTAAYRPTLVVQLSAAPVGSTAVVMAAGDMVCPVEDPVTSTTCRHPEVAAMVAAAAPDRYIAIGDTEQGRARLADYYRPGGYDDTYGAIKSITLPVVGNHEYTDPSGPAQGYFDYFYGPGVTDGPFGTRPDGYYATTIGSWRFIALNSECAPDDANARTMVAGGCGVGSPQYAWLQGQLADAPACTVVAYHRPRWTTGLSHPPYAGIAPMWDLMSAAGVDVALNGHVHSTEIFRQIGVSGATTTNPVLDQGGIRQFVSGIGGDSLRSFPSPGGAMFNALEARNRSAFGALKLTLRPTSYDWEMVPIPGHSFTNSGTTGQFSGTSSCH